MDFQDFSAGLNDRDKRLDKLLRALFPDLSLSEIYKLIRKKLIKVNGKNVKENYRIKKDDVISVPNFVASNKKIGEVSISDSRENFELESQKIDIAFENEHILILNKPYDVNVHGSENSLEKKVQKYYSQKKSDNSLTFKTGPLHRLDKKTTGLIAFSMSLQGARWFSQNIKERKIEKIYYAVLEGELKNKGETLIWSDYIENSRKKNDDFFTVNAASATDSKNNPNAKNAELFITPLSYGKINGKTATFAKIILKTGRKHQIRAQAALRGFPLLGDKAYGSKENLRAQGYEQDFFLQATELNIPQNDLGLPSIVTIPLNKEFKFLLNSCALRETDI